MRVTGRDCNGTLETTNNKKFERVISKKKWQVVVEVTDRSKIGTKKFTKAHLSFACPKIKETVNGNERRNQGYRIDRLWRGMDLNSDRDS